MIDAESVAPAVRRFREAFSRLAALPPRTKALVLGGTAVALLGAVLLRLLGGRLPLGADPDQDSVVAAETTSASSAGGVQTRPSSPT